MFNGLPGKIRQRQAQNTANLFQSRRFRLLGTSFPSGNGGAAFTDMLGQRCLGESARLTSLNQSLRNEPRYSLPHDFFRGFFLSATSA